MRRFAVAIVVVLVVGCKGSVEQEVEARRAKAVVDRLRAQEEIQEAERAARAARPDAAIAAAATDPDLPESAPDLADCARLAAAITSLAACDALPRESRDAMRYGLAATRNTWRRLATAEERRAANVACVDALAATRITADGRGCPL